MENRNGSKSSSDQGRYFDHRSTGRSDVDIKAEIRESGAGRFQIVILDLSQSGFRMRSLTYINPEKAIYLTLPGMAPLEAHVCWNDNDMYGCEFKRPLHPAVFEFIAKRFPVLR